MPSLRILGTGRIDNRDSAYPQAVQLPDGDILCSFTVGGGPALDGGTDWARSPDGGLTWRLEGTILPPTEQPRSVNSLRLTLSADGKTVLAYGARLFREIGQKLGDGRREAVLCTSTDAGRTWSAARRVPMPVDCPLEVSHGILPLSSGRLLAPAATLPSKDRLGEQVFVAISDDGGRDWPAHAIVLEDGQKILGFFEHKFAEIAPGRVLATAWTVTLGDVLDRPNSFAISNDDGSTWGPVRSTGIQGQTLTPTPLGGDRLFVVFNRRYGRQGVVMGLVTFTEEAWIVHHEELLYDAKAVHEGLKKGQSGFESLDAFQFGLPTAIPLQDRTILATHWCRENGTFGIRWTKLAVDW
jgi:sialidase-1